MLESLYEQGNGWSLMTEHQMDELIRLRKEKEELDNKPFNDLVTSYKDYAKRYDLKILKQCGYGTKSPLEVLTAFQDFMSKSFYYITYAPDNHYGNENDYFFYPELWKALQDKGFVDARHLAAGFSCGGAAGKISTIARIYYGFQTTTVAIPKNGEYTGHEGEAVLLSDGWYVFSPGYIYSNCKTEYWSGYIIGPCTAQSTGENLTYYNRIVKTIKDTPSYYQQPYDWPYKN